MTNKGGGDQGSKQGRQSATEKKGNLGPHRQGRGKRRDLGGFGCGRSKKVLKDMGKVAGQHFNDKERGVNKQQRRRVLSKTPNDPRGGQGLGR